MLSNKHSMDISKVILEAKNWTQTFFYQTFRALPGYPGKIPGGPAKKRLISLVSRDISNFLAPTPSRGRPLPHRKISGVKSLGLCSFLRTGFRAGDEDSNFSVFRVRRFSEWPEPLHWIAFAVEILTKPLIHWIASPFFTENPFFHWKVLRRIPFPKIGSDFSCLIFLPCKAIFPGKVKGKKTALNVSWLGQRKGGEHRTGEGSETFLEKWVLRRFPVAS